jgi:hypothetical protein
MHVNKGAYPALYNLVCYFHTYMLRLFSFIIFISIASISNAQVLIQGRVFDISKKTPLESVAALTNSGRGAITDSLGRYTLNVKETDTIYFSFMGKNTNKFPVAEIKDHLNFDISIHVMANELPGVTVKNRNYLLDSIQNRKDYAKIFNYRKPTLRLSTNPNYTPGGVGAAFDLTEIINMFRFKRNRQILSLQKRLVQQEQDKYIDKRFSKRFITKITGLQAGSLDSFMLFYRPPYEFLLAVNDLELGVYIQKCYKHFEGVRKGEFIRPPRLETLY